MESARVFLGVLIVAGSSAAAWATACTATVTGLPPASGFEGGLGDPAEQDSSTGGDAGGPLGADTGPSRQDAGQDAAPAACNATAAGCVTCAATTCAAPSVCCGDGTSRACAASCDAGMTGLSEACEKPADCSGGTQCCVNAEVAIDGGASGTTACSSDCSPQNGSTGSGYITTGPACASSADCASVTGEFGVPYGNCCKAPGFDVGHCMSDTFAGEYQKIPGASCD